MSKSVHMSIHVCSWTCSLALFILFQCGLGLPWTLRWLPKPGGVFHGNRELCSGDACLGHDWKGCSLKPKTYIIGAASHAGAVPYDSISEAAAGREEMTALPDLTGCSRLCTQNVPFQVVTGFLFQTQGNLQVIVRCCGQSKAAPLSYNWD